MAGLTLEVFPFAQPCGHHLIVFLFVSCFSNIVYSRCEICECVELKRTKKKKQRKELYCLGPKMLFFFLLFLNNDLNFDPFCQII